MRIRTRALAATAAVLAVCTAAGCAADRTPESEAQATSTVSGSDVETVAEVDVTQLDTGDYPTTPAAPFGEAAPEDRAAVDAQRMAQFVVAPFEVDRELNDPTLPTMVLRGYQQLKGTFDESVVNVPANTSSWVYGFVTSATVSAPVERGTTGRALTQLVMRYTDPTAAADAARQMGEASAALDGSTPAIVTAMPDSHAVRGTQPNGSLTMQAFTAHNDYVVYTWASAPVAEADRLEPTLVKALELQAPLIDQFPPTPTKSQAQGRHIPIEVDQNDILIYAVPAGKNDPMGDILSGVYGPRGMSHFYYPPETVYRALTEHGSVHNAINKTTVFRASTDQDARELLDTFTSSSLSGGWAEAATPPGLPSATCLSKASPSGEQYQCSVRVGRYIGDAVGLGDQTEVHQLISAQYLILTQADQNAE
ncbi:DUF7373 family lipoprotein [Rhodococcus gannanensis]|uniref:Lipoprotein n=1 Tax=Rhodococcus gannanensis TaxID=1960308 RepID=A0ABW4P462_9NOCA